MAYCNKCGEQILGDEDSLCGDCAGEMLEGNTNGEENIDWDIENDLYDENNMGY